MSNWKGKFKKEIKRTFCMFMTAATLVSCIDLPVNAAEAAEELLEEAETEIPVEDVEEESVIMTDTEENRSETVSTELTVETETTVETEITVEAETTVETETAVFTEAEEEAEETNLAEEQVANYPTGGFIPQQISHSGFMPGSGSWTIDRNGKLTVTGKGEFHVKALGSASIPWYEYRKEIKTAVITRTGATDFSDLFKDCDSLTSVDLSQCDTSKAVSMRSMFSGCHSLETIDLGNFNTANVTNMGWMFAWCKSLKSIKFGTNFKTDKVTDMEAMFYFCQVLPEIGLSRFNTANVTNMSLMFADCWALTSIDLRNFNTAKVTDMSRMFDSCAITNYDLHSFNTSKVTNMEYMFTSCDAESLDLSNFDMSKVTKADKMIYSCYLTDMKTPRNVKISIPFSHGTWMKDNGTIITALPQNQSQSIHVQQKKELTARKSTTTYYIGDKLDLSDLTVELVYSKSEENTQYVYITNYTTNAAQINMNTAGTKDLIISYQGLSVTIKLTVIGGSLDVSKRKTSYYCGQTLDVSDLIVRVKYDNNLSDLIKQGYTTNAASIDMSTAGTKKLIVTYLNMTATVEITVTSEWTYSIKASKKTTIYYCGQKLDLSDLTVDLYRSKANAGDTEYLGKITDYTTNADSIDMQTLGTKKLIISARGTTTNITLTVLAKQTCDKMAFDTVVQTGTKLDEDDIWLCVDLPDGEIATHQYTANFDKIDLSTPGVKKVQVTWRGVTDEIDLYVIEAFCDDDIAHGNNDYVTYKIDKNGNLTVAGYGEFTDSYNNPLWWDNRQSIKTAKVMLSDTDNMKGLFQNCVNLKSVDFLAFDTGSITNMANMFFNCESLTSLDLSGFDTKNVTDISNMFCGCENLTSLDLSSFDIKSDTITTSMLSSCSKLTALYTPKSVKATLSLPSGEWHDISGNIIQSPLTNMDKSIYIIKNKVAIPQKPETESSESEESSASKESSNVEESSITAESSETEENAPSEEYSQVEESSASKESSNVEESSATAESSKIEESSATVESGKTEESSASKESSNVEESSTTVESGKTEESSTTVESSKTEESSTSMESSKTEESSTTVESSKTEESSTTEESSRTEESSTTEESSKTEESSDADKTDFNKIDGKISVIKAKVYDGTAYEPFFKVTVTENKKKITLTEGVDYEIEYQNNICAGTGTVLVKGNGVYKGTLKAAFEITPKSLKKIKVITGSMTTGSSAEPPVYVYDGATLLTNGTDYKLTYDNSRKQKAAKSIKITITATGNYKDSKTVTLPVYSVDASYIINPKNVTLQTTAMPYTGKQLKPVPTVKIGSTLLSTKDYKVQYQNNTNAGTAYVIVTGKGAYQGKVVVPFTITPLKASSAPLTIVKIPDKTYNGKLQKPSVTVKAGTKKLVQNKDYIITYTNNLHASTSSKKAKVTVTGIGNYAGLSASAAFTIKPQMISKASVKGTQENLTVTYSGTKLTENEHYMISADKSGAKNNKIKITITGLGDFAGSTVTKKIKVK